MDFLNELNKSQYAAVTYTDGPSLVIAGAGSGKTRVLTYKIAYLLSNGISPASILALTFTNKAAREMRKRIGELVGFKTSRYLMMGTFHSIFSRILRNEAELLGFTKDFTIYDSSDSKSLIKDIIRGMKLDDKVYKPGNVHGRISGAKNNLFTAEAYKSNSDLIKSDEQARMPRIAEIYSAYAWRCKQANAMDFDDLLLLTAILFRNHPEVLHKYQNMFGFILVDEYQDTNFAQYLIIKNLADNHHRVCVVGDDAQSIYSFRGANIDNILKFQQTYREARIFKLEQNYRSTKTIVNAANSLIDKNSEQIKKTIFSEKEEGELIEIRSLHTDMEEAHSVAKSIGAECVNEKINFNDIAVLYRTNSQSRVMEEALRKQNIPYRIYGGLSFYQRKEIKDIISYFRLITNHNDEEALKRVINFPARGIGNVTIDKLSETAHQHGVSMWTVLEDMLKYKLNVNAGTSTKLSQFRNLIVNLSNQLFVLDAYELANLIVKSTGVIADAMQDRSADNLSRIDNMQELLNAIHEFSDNKRAEGEEMVYLPDFLSEVSLLSDQDTQQNESEDDKVTLMTIHAAKGLEFNTVFIVGLEEQLFPSPYALSPREMEEERRLFYVAITRAEKKCFISYSKSRFRNGTTNFANPSRFLRDIDEAYVSHNETAIPRQSSLFGSDYYDEINIERNRFRQTPFQSKATQAYTPEPAKPKNLKRIGKETPNEMLTENATYPAGTFVKHSTFGLGKIIETSIADGNEKAKIDFGENGVKTLLLKFAKLEVLQ